MTFALALRSLKAKPLRTLASVAAIAVAVAMFFCMFSFEGAVYDYVYAVETADFGDSDIIISQKSGGDRIAPDDPLYDVEGVESVTATVSLYALLDGEGEEEYLRLRGFDGGEVESLRDIDVVAGDISRMAENTDCVVISERMAERFGLGIDDLFSVRGMTASGRSVHFYVVAIAENSGYFASDSPYTVLGYSSRMSSVMLSGGTVHNEIFVKVAEGADISKVRERIAAIPEYSALTVAECLDLGYISTRARNLSAPVTIAGAAVALLCIAGVALVSLARTFDEGNMTEEYALPTELWLCYGSHDDGDYSQEDYDYCASLPDLESRRKAVYISFFTFHIVGVVYVYNRCLKAGKADIIPVFGVWGGQFVLVFVPCQRRLCNGRAAGITQAQGAADLVKGLPCRVVYCLAYYTEMCVIIHRHNVAVTAGGHKAKERRFQLRICKIQRGDMSAQMVHRHQRLTRSKGQPLGIIYSHQQCSDKAGAKGTGHRFQIVYPKACFVQSLLHHLADGIYMASAGYFRHNTAIKAVFFRLGINHIGYYFSPVLHYGRRCFVTAGLYAQYIHQISLPCKFSLNPLLHIWSFP